MEGLGSLGAPGPDSEHTQNARKPGPMLGYQVTGKSQQGLGWLSLEADGLSQLPKRAVVCHCPGRSVGTGSILWPFLSTQAALPTCPLGGLG